MPNVPATSHVQRQRRPAKPNSFRTGYRSRTKNIAAARHQGRVSCPLCSSALPGVWSCLRVTPGSMSCAGGVRQRAQQTPAYTECAAPVATISARGVASKSRWKRCWSVHDGLFRNGMSRRGGRRAWITPLQHGVLPRSPPGLIHWLHECGEGNVTHARQQGKRISCTSYRPGGTDACFAAEPTCGFGSFAVAVSCRPGEGHAHLICSAKLLSLSGGTRPGMPGRLLIVWQQICDAHVWRAGVPAAPTAAGSHNRAHKESAALASSHRPPKAAA